MTLFPRLGGLLVCLPLLLPCAAAASPNTSHAPRPQIRAVGAASAMTHPAGVQVCQLGSRTLTVPSEESELPAPTPTPAEETGQRSTTPRQPRWWYPWGSQGGSGSDRDAPPRNYE